MLSIPLKAHLASCTSQSLSWFSWCRTLTEILVIWFLVIQTKTLVVLIGKFTIILKQSLFLFYFTSFHFIFLSLLLTIYKTVETVYTLYKNKHKYTYYIFVIKKITYHNEDVLFWHLGIPGPEDDDQSYQNL